MTGPSERHHPHLMALLVAVLALVAMVWSETIPVNGGRGWDGDIYGRLTEDFYGRVIVDKVDAYRLGRVLPSAVVHYGLRLFGLPTADTSTMLRGYEVYNALWLVAGVYLWNAIATRLALSMRGKWLGFIGLYANFAVLKMTPYYPILTDTTGFVGGLVILWAFLAERRLVLALTAVLGAFTWPTLLPMVLPLLVFPRSRAVTTTEAPPAPAWMWALPALLVAAAAWSRHAIAHQPSPPTVPPVWGAILPLSAALVFAYLAWSLRALLDRELPKRLLRPFAYVDRRGVAWAVAAVVVAFLLKRWLVNTQLKALSNGSVLEITLLLSILKPGVSLVAHVVYFGPMAIVVMLCWPETCRLVRSLGLGMTLVALFGILLGITSESRHLSSFFPIAVALTMPSLEARAGAEAREHRSADLVFVVASLAASKVWMRFNRAPLAGEMSDFPYQYYLMNHGPWMSDLTFAVQGALVLVLAVVAWRFAARSRHSLG